MSKTWSMRAGIVVAIGVAIGAAPVCAVSPYDGTWSAQVTTGSCAGATIMLTVTDGAVTGSVHTPFGQNSFTPSKIGADGKVILTTKGFAKAGGLPTYVTFAGDHFEAHRHGSCGDFTVTGTRTSH